MNIKKGKALTRTCISAIFTGVILRNNYRKDQEERENKKIKNKCRIFICIYVKDTQIL